MAPEKAKLSSRLQFHDWERVLHESTLPACRKESWAITIRWYLSWSKRARVPIDFDSARDFMAQVELDKHPSAHRLEQWKDALRWFFREGHRRHGRIGRIQRSVTADRFIRANASPHNSSITSNEGLETGSAEGAGVTYVPAFHRHPCPRPVPQTCDTAEYNSALQARAPAGFKPAIRQSTTLRYGPERFRGNQTYNSALRLPRPTTLVPLSRLPA